MRVDIVVILEPGWQLLHDGDGIWPWVYAGIVALQGFDEGLADAVAFRASDRREAWNKVQRGCEIDGLNGGIGGTIISQSLDRRGRAERIEPSLDAIKHLVADHFARDAAGLSGDPGDDLAVMGVDGAGDAHYPAVPAWKLKAIGCPALVRGRRDDAALMSPNGTPAGMRLQQH
jgi:hypothetical protein